MKKTIISFLVMLFLVTLPIGTSTNHKVEAIWFQSPQLEVHFINVGQGDGVLVIMPNGKKMLVDGGPRESGIRIVDYLKKHSIDELDLVVSTHPDADHIGGLIHVLQNIKVKQVLDSGKLHTTETYREYLQIVRRNQIPMEIAKIGQSVELDQRVDVTILNSHNADEENNEASIVMKITLGKVDYLLAADAEGDSEEEMLARQDLEAEIMKVAHHGSVTSTSEEFLNKVDPKIAILSFGAENPYGHPHKEVVQRLKEHDIKIYSTSEYESLVVKTNGRSYKIYSKIDEVGQLKAAHPKQYVGNLAIVELDLKKEKIMIKNNRDHDVLMMGWKIISEVGNQVFQFPPDYVLKAGDTVTVYSTDKKLPHHSDVLWWLEETNIWNDVGDRALLFTPNGGLADYEGKKSS
ncbi:beta-lactamase superfamily II metal-dependent hydrolase [Bacillus mesophilus]|uniref:MBL fold metallo-hydrolase n=1 Tax=Bacillus mesophilus TaxID=1808955 RepID=UPI00195D1A65|nr:MBL fold metallo-hydrolase [Bacillus mesophilus]MBM7663047.1 beta-lactamase superfamily II metal-dependent hydrolase [Bacillus mesophilus]